MRLILEILPEEHERLKTVLSSRKDATVTIRIGRESFTGSLYVAGELRAASVPYGAIRVDGALIPG